MGTRFCRNGHFFHPGGRGADGLRQKLGLRDRLSYGGFDRQGPLRAEGEQQPQNNNEPDIIMPLAADLILQQALSNKQEHNQQPAGIDIDKKFFIDSLSPTAFSARHIPRLSAGCPEPGYRPGLCS